MPSRHNFSRWWVASVVAAMVITPATSCSKAPQIAPANYLHVDINTSPTALDPRIASDAISARVDELVYEPMVTVDRRGNFIGVLAESVERPTPTRLVFHLRRGVRFSDGRELSSRDVLYTYSSILAPTSHSMKAASLAEMASLRALDEHTVEMITRRPYAPALEMAMVSVVPAGAPLSANNNGMPPAGTGPFRIVHFQRDQVVVLARNPFRAYPAEAAAGLVLKIVPDATVRALELVEGICDFAENDAVQPELIPYLARHDELRVERSPGTTFEYLAFNFRDQRLRDLRLRQAFAYAIDRDAIVKTMLRGNARVATGLLTPENWAYDGDVMRFPYDPARAKRLLEEAGYAPGDARLRFVYTTTPEGRRRAEVLQAMLKRVGITLEVRTNEWATFYADIQRGNFDLAPGQWLGINDPHHYFLIYDSRMTPPYGMNRGGYSNAVMDRLVEAGDGELDPARRREIYGGVQRLAAQDLPYVPLWWIDTVTVMNRRIGGFIPYPNGNLISLATAAYASGSARNGD